MALCYFIPSVSIFIIIMNGRVSQLQWKMEIRLSGAIVIENCFKFPIWRYNTTFAGLNAVCTSFFLSKYCKLNGIYMKNRLIPNSRPMEINFVQYWNTLYNTKSSIYISTSKSIKLHKMEHRKFIESIAKA